jgi:mannose-1-phosphate guanylyltransferase
MLSLDGDRSMLQQTIDRLLSLADASQCWIIAGSHLVPAIAAQLPNIPADHILAEPAPRNTGPAIGLAAFLTERLAPDAVLGFFPADHAIEDAAEFKATMLAGCDLAAKGENIVVLGIQPTRPETGYGYIETGERIGASTYRVRCFTEKPDLDHAQQFLAAGNYFWNSGMFLGKAATFANAVREHLPKTAARLEKIAASFGSEAFERTFAEIYPSCENISIDYAVMEPCSAKGELRSNLYCVPAKFGWNDLGSWAALYEHKLAHGEDVAEDGNVIEAVADTIMDSNGNFIHAPKKHVALVGVEGLVVVETEDALLVTTRDRCQSVGKLVQRLQKEKQETLL